MNLPKIVVEAEEEAGTAVNHDSSTFPAIPTAIPSFPVLPDTKRSILKSNLRTYEAAPVKLTPGLDPTQLSTSPVYNQAPRVRFASSDHIFHVRISVHINYNPNACRLQRMIKL